MALLPPFNFLTLHYAYFIFVSLLSSVLFWGVANVREYFLCRFIVHVAASTLSTFQQVILFLLLMLGHAILISSTVLLVRRRAFQRKFQGISKALARRSARTAPSPGDGVDYCPKGKCDIKTYPKSQIVPVVGSSRSIDEDHIQWLTSDLPPPTAVNTSIDLERKPDQTRDSSISNKKIDLLPPMGLFRGTQKYFESKGLISRNSQFHGLTPEEREKLQGVEYKAVTFLSVIVPLYWVMFIICGIVGMGAWLEVNKPELPRENGLSPFWTGAFFAVSAFVNSGMGILDANMTALQTNTYPLITMGFLILAGNTLYPCFLRFIIWTMRLMIPNRPSWKSWKITLDFILDHPRRVYTNLFPARHTWFLMGTIIVLNGIDWAAFEVLSIGNEEIDSLPTSYRILDGLFQSLAVRAGGFTVVTIANLRQGLLVLYVLMMYLSPYPVLLTMRSTNVYEERSLGIYAQDDALNEFNQQASDNRFTRLVRRHFLTKEGTRRYFIREQLRDQLSHDLWWIALAVFLISIIESHNYTLDPVGFSTFNIIFEVITAYGCVGISTGYPGTSVSFCGVWHSLSKLILAAVALRGRHRGLPVVIDKAIMLPNESLAWAEEEDAALRQDKMF
ncbi:hypothetical protein ARAM_004090 [Aspergillus rambellii]|uniref:Potassium transport protein n=1 Tax=Aspergillus rambellii TaxID=308745 RepID=A0A0F8WUR0_9EURO|nr:hypothetical protein ARAM_004090 [Aspergillus rambellii]